MDACAHGGMVACEAQLATHVLDQWNAQATAAAACDAAAPSVLLPLPPPPAVAGVGEAGRAGASGPGAAAGAVGRQGATASACQPKPLRPTPALLAPATEATEQHNADEQQGQAHQERPRRQGSTCSAYLDLPASTVTTVRAYHLGGCAITLAPLLLFLGVRMLWLTPLLLLTYPPAACTPWRHQSPGSMLWVCGP